MTDVTVPQPDGSSRAPNQGKAARDLNDTIRYTMWSVFHLREVIGDGDRAAEANEVEKLFEDLAASDVVVRGLYDVSGLRADAELMVWWHAETSDELQKAFHRFRRTSFGSRLDPVWSQMALHRPAEFNKSHIPAFLAHEEVPLVGPHERVHTDVLPGLLVGQESRDMTLVELRRPVQRHLRPHRVEAGPEGGPAEPVERFLPVSYTHL